MTEIEPGLFIGNAESSYSRTLLSTNNINAIVSLTGSDYSLWYTYTGDYVPVNRHYRIICRVSSTQDLLVHLKGICDFIDNMSAPIQTTQQEQTGAIKQSADSSRVTPGVVLVHCVVGVGRSETAIIAYLMRKYKMTVVDALRLVGSKRTINPNNFIRQLDIWGAVGYQIWEVLERKKPKPLYQAFLDDRSIALKK
jgi:dual specificity phosphatase 12